MSGVAVFFYNSLKLADRYGTELLLVDDARFCSGGIPARDRFPFAKFVS